MDWIYVAVHHGLRDITISRMEEPLLYQTIVQEFKDRYGTGWSVLWI